MYQAALFAVALDEGRVCDHIGRDLCGVRQAHLVVSTVCGHCENSVRAVLNQCVNSVRTV
jgi:hypothetical protein